MKDIWRNIAESRIILADITGRNPNVLYELGISHAIDKDVVILTQRESDIPFDLKIFRHIIYEDNADGYEVLEKYIPLFIEEYLFGDLADNFGKQIQKDDILLLFISTGGTCRCAMANAITRYYLKRDFPETKIKPVSAGLLERTSFFASQGAKKVILDKLGKSLENHITIKADFELLKRANLILTMDLKLLAAIPDQFKNKAELFTRFLGSAGFIYDPYGGGIKAYENCFLELNKLISENMVKIIELSENA